MPMPRCLPTPMFVCLFPPSGAGPSRGHLTVRQLDGQGLPLRIQVHRLAPRGSTPAAARPAAPDPSLPTHPHPPPPAHPPHAEAGTSPAAAPCPPRMLAKD
eukprot:gene6623-6359_t